jgi:oligo-1,6-glucosidase
LKVNPNFVTVNVEAQEKDLDSPLNYFRKITKLRKQEPTLVYGKYTLLDKENPNVFAYTRELNGRKLLVLLNFSSENAKFNSGIDMKKSKIISSNYLDLNPLKESVLHPFEALIIEIN